MSMTPSSTPTSCGSSTSPKAVSEVSADETDWRRCPLALMIARPIPISTSQSRRRELRRAVGDIDGAGARAASDGAPRNAGNVYAEDRRRWPRALSFARSLGRRSPRKWIRGRWAEVEVPRVPRAAGGDSSCTATIMSSSFAFVLDMLASAASCMLYMLLEQPSLAERRGATAPRSRAASASGARRGRALLRRGGTGGAALPVLARARGRSDGGGRAPPEMRYDGATYSSVLAGARPVRRSGHLLVEVHADVAIRVAPPHHVSRANVSTSTERR